MNMAGNLDVTYEPLVLDGWDGCSHLDCLPACRFQQGHCERLRLHLEADTFHCPKCKRVMHDGDCAEDDCPYAAVSSGDETR